MNDESKLFIKRMIDGANRKLALTGPNEKRDVIILDYIDGFFDAEANRRDQEITALNVMVECQSEVYHNFTNKEEKHMFDEQMLKDLNLHRPLSEKEHATTASIMCRVDQYFMNEIHSRDETISALKEKIAKKCEINTVCVGMSDDQAIQAKIMLEPFKSSEIQEKYKQIVDTIHNRQATVKVAKKELDTTQIHLY
jgi:hypothetical protein